MYYPQFFDSFRFDPVNNQVRFKNYISVITALGKDMSAFWKHPITQREL